MTFPDGLPVAIVGMHYAPETTGNAPYTTAMAEAMSAAGARVHVITGIPHYPQWEITDPRYRAGQGRYWQEREGGIRITRCRHHVPREPDLVGRALMEMSFFRRASTVLRHESPAVVIAVTPTLSALGAAAAFGGSRPLGALVQDLTGHAAAESGSTGGRVARLIGRAEYALLRRCAQVGVIAPRFGEVLIRNGVEPDRVRQLSNFSHIEAVDATPAEARRRLGWTQDRFTVVHTGNMGRKQGLEVVVEAAKIAHQRGDDIDFVLVGDGNQRRALEAMGDGLPNLRFVPPLERDDYPYALAAADVLLITEAPGCHEMSLPSKLTSYTAAGRPVVASLEHGGITFDELNRFHAARFAGAGEPAELLDAVGQLRTSPSLAESIVAGGRELFRKQYGRHAAYERYVQFAADLYHGSTARQIPQAGCAGVPE
jgi:colanic acid biosynthesis glycosyl transferase WcaI